mmetsp:Transcript_36608/g.121235  ORF Transcript_36608/g.121235 Transcript_36608/m.121235 type:complete len:201 (+) Transcript_36608:1161-1763(+)
MDLARPSDGAHVALELVSQCGRNCVRALSKKPRLARAALSTHNLMVLLHRGGRPAGAEGGGDLGPATVRAHLRDQPPQLRFLIAPPSRLFGGGLSLALGRLVLLVSLLAQAHAKRADAVGGGELTHDLSRRNVHVRPHIAELRNHLAVVAVGSRLPRHAQRHGHHVWIGVHAAVRGDEAHAVSRTPPLHQPHRLHPRLDL